jgi:hypothetical protein
MAAVRKLSLALGLMAITNEFIAARCMIYGIEIDPIHIYIVCTKYCLQAFTNMTMRNLKIVFEKFNLDRI